MKIHCIFGLEDRKGKCVCLFLPEITLFVYLYILVLVFNPSYFHFCTYHVERPVLIGRQFLQLFALDNLIFIWKSSEFRL